jgi:hypothetical protein
MRTEIRNTLDRIPIVRFAVSDSLVRSPKGLAELLPYSHCPHSGPARPRVRDRINQRR